MDRIICIIEQDNYLICCERFEGRWEIVEIPRIMLFLIKELPEFKQHIPRFDIEMMQFAREMGIE